MLSNRPTRRRRAPSSRNLEIHAQVKIRGLRQADVARDNKITQSRVSRIVAQVEAWRGTCPDAQDQLSVTERRRHERWLARERWEELYQRSIEELAASHRTLTTERSGSRDGRDFHEQTSREQATSVQWLKAAIKAAENLLDLAELEPLPKAPSHEENAASERYKIEKWLIHKRINAEQSQNSEKSSNAAELVGQWLAALMGEEPRFGMHRMANPGPAVQELVRRFVLPKATATVPRPAAEQLAAETVDAEPLDAESLGAGAPETAADANCHMRHTPAVEMSPDDAGDRTAEVTASCSSQERYWRLAAANGIANMPDEAKKYLRNMTPATPPVITPPGPTPPSSTPEREPWEEEYEQMKRERKTISLPMGSVTRS